MKDDLSTPISLPGQVEPALHARIREVLRNLIDPETGLDFLRMGLVRSMEIQQGTVGKKVLLAFRPTSPVCPLAFKLAWDLKKTVEALEGIESVEIKVEGYNRASELEAILGGGRENLETDK